MDEAIAILKLCAHEHDGLRIRALHDGDRIEPWETVMTIEGDYTTFAHLETVYLGMLARRTLITTNVVARASRRPTGSRSSSCRRVTTTIACRPATATRRSSPARIAGAEIGVTTDEQASWWGGRGIGTVPHSLIASYGGDTVLAARKFAEWAPAETNDHRARRLRERLGADGARGRGRARRPAVGRPARHLRGARRPLALGGDWATSGRRGVNERLVRKVRAALDAAGHEQVRIVASGGFTVAKIREFEERGVPVDAYGVGSSLIRGSNDFTADVVLTDGEPSGKVGRHVRDNPRLEPVA